MKIISINSSDLAILVGSLVVGAIVGGLLVTISETSFVIGAWILLSVATFSLIKPIVLLNFIILTSAAAGLFRSFESVDIGQGDMTVSGLRWVFVAGISLLAIGCHIRKVRIPKVFRPFILFVLWAILRSATASGVLGIKDILFYSLIPLTGIYTLLVLAIYGKSAIERIDANLLYSPFIPLFLYIVCIPLGLIYLTPNGPDGIMDPRPLALYLVVVLSLSLAQWRYGVSSISRLQGKFITFLTLGTILFTLSRIASLSALLLLAAAIVNPARPLRYVPLILVTPALAILLLLQIPSYRERSFFRAREGASLEENWQHLNSQGRFDHMWPTTFNHAKEKPILGWGPGTARILVAGAIRREKEEHHPHNEYLQVFHDMGILGIILLLAAWFPLLFRHWKSWKAAHQGGKLFQAKWNMSATLSIVMILLSSITDNTLHYTFVLAPAFIIIAVAIWIDEVRSPCFNQLALVRCRGQGCSKEN